MITLDRVNATLTPHKRLPWNKGKLTGAKPPLRPKHVWSIRTKLQIEGRARASSVAVTSSNQGRGHCCKRIYRGSCTGEDRTACQVRVQRTDPPSYKAAPSRSPTRRRPASAGASAARPGRRPVAFRSDSLARRNVLACEIVPTVDEIDLGGWTRGRHLERTPYPVRSHYFFLLWQWPRHAMARRCQMASTVRCRFTRAHPM